MAIIKKEDLQKLGSTNVYNKPNRLEPALTDDDAMPFGKYKGESMSEIPDEYLKWLYQEGCNNTKVKNYIYNSFPELRK